MTIAIRVAVILSLFVTMLMFSACRHSAMDEGWGQAHDEIVKRMSANLWASERGAAPIPLDPKTGELIAEGYYEKLKAKK